MRRHLYCSERNVHGRSRLRLQCLTRGDRETDRLWVHDNKVRGDKYEILTDGLEPTVMATRID